MRHLEKRNLHPLYTNVLNGHNKFAVISDCGQLIP